MPGTTLNVSTGIRPTADESEKPQVKVATEMIFESSAPSTNREASSKRQLHGAVQQYTFSPPPQQLPPLDWTGSLLRIGPLAGLAALEFAVLQTAASFAILKASDGDAVETWKYQPTVYLATLVAVSNKALAFAAVQGTIVTWWLKATRGTKLAQLHNDYGMGLHIYKAAVAGRRFYILALACICATVVAIDGPLLQRASTVRLKVPSLSVDWNIAMTPELPAFWSGSILYKYMNGTIGLHPETVSTEFYHIYQEYSAAAPMSGRVSGCSGTCTATIRAPALSLDSCQSTLRCINYSKPFTSQEVRWLYNVPAAPYKRTVFELQFDTYNGTRQGLAITTNISDASVAKSCAGYLNDTTCLYVSAIGEYPIIIANGTIRFTSPPSSPHIVALANNTAVNDQTLAEFGNQTREGYVRSTMSGLSTVGNMQFREIQSLVPPSVTGQRAMVLDPDSSWFIWRHIANLAAWNDGSACAPEWGDPHADILAGINELMFRAGLHTAIGHDETWLKRRIDPGLEIDQKITGVLESPIPVFESDFGYFAGAATVELVTVVIILVTFCGYWRLGHNTSFSPLEIAKAFDAPLLDTEQSNLNGNRLARSCGARKVLYGVEELVRSDSQGRLERSEKLQFAEEFPVHGDDVSKPYN